MRDRPARLPFLTVFRKASVKIRPQIGQSTGVCAVRLLLPKPDGYGMVSIADADLMDPLCGQGSKQRLFGRAVGTPHECIRIAGNACPCH
jgi:hypothetical protein